MDTVMTAVNEEFAANDEVIHDGDEIAFIPPVSGG
jgi:sulfur-carrier protein